MKCRNDDRIAMRFVTAMRLSSIVFLLASSIASPAQTSSTRSADTSTHEEELLAKSQEAGLLTYWHLEGRFGRGRAEEFLRKFAPERKAQKAAMRPNPAQRYELVFPEGRFVLPPAMASLKGVFFASSSTYLSDSGDWNVYLESATEAIVFVDGKKVLEAEPNATGVIRATIHAESAYHSVMVKFTAQATPLRVAILPPNSGSRRRNNAPDLQASPATEDMTAENRRATEYLSSLSRLVIAE